MNLSEHTLVPGKNLISALCGLGEALGYHVEREYPVESDRTFPPAVDVAWFAEPGHLYPLMIFEVESRATSSIANNATKVFGQASSQFEKPLFFFHIVVESADSARLAVLERLFGTYNYRSFNLSQVDLGSVLEAVLSQHRRIHRTVRLLPLRRCLDLPGWEGVTPEALISTIGTLGFEADFEPAMSANALRSREDTEAFVTWLVDFDGLNQPNQIADMSYEAYLGWYAARPLHCGIVAAHRPPLAKEMADQFRTWQENSAGGMTRIGPYFGLSMDYDEFLIGGAPALCAVLGALMPTLATELLNTLDSIRSHLADWAGAPNAIWALHLAAAVADDGSFEAARNHLNRMGGVNEDMVLRPAAFYDAMGDETWPTDLAVKRQKVPSRAVLCRKMGDVLRRDVDRSAVLAALRFLADDRYGLEPPLDLLSALHENCHNTS